MAKLGKLSGALLSGLLLSACGAETAVQSVQVYALDSQCLRAKPGEFSVGDTVHLISVDEDDASMEAKIVAFDKTVSCGMNRRVETFNAVDQDYEFYTLDSPHPDNYLLATKKRLDGVVAESCNTAEGLRFSAMSEGKIIGYEYIYLGYESPANCDLKKFKAFDELSKG